MVLRCNRCHMLLLSAAALHGEMCAMAAMGALGNAGSVRHSLPAGVSCRTGRPTQALLQCAAKLTLLVLQPL